jgi:hypothetical protein
LLTVADRYELSCRKSMVCELDEIIIDSLF